jgi:hypothetical protein
METATDLIIDERFVIHVLDNRRPTAQFSRALTPLPETLRATLHSYLSSVLKPRFRRKHYGRFRPDAIVLKEYQGLLADVERQGAVDSATFLAMSQRLALHLFTAMQQSGNPGSAARAAGITPGDMLVGLFYTQAPASARVPYLFILKLELESALQRQIHQEAAGGMHTILIRQEGLLPKLTAEHVQKSALIRFADNPAAYDVILTDPQGAKRGVAKFFAEDFLQTEPFHTPDKQAELLFRRANTWVAEHEETLSPQERGDVVASVQTLLEDYSARAEPVTPRQLVEALPLSESREPAVMHELRQSFEEMLTAPQQEDEVYIPIDHALLIQHIPQPVAKTRVTYQLDHGVQISGERESIARLFTTPPHRVGTATEFTIRTQTFRPVL